MEHYENNLKVVRKAKGFIQREVARLMNLQCEARLSEWENGGATPSVFNLFRLCDIYEISPTDAFTRIKQE